MAGQWIGLYQRQTREEEGASNSAAGGRRWGTDRKHEYRVRWQQGCFGGFFFFFLLLVYFGFAYFQTLVGPPKELVIRILARKIHTCVFFHLMGH